MEILKFLCPEVNERLVQEHLNRLDDNYFQRFSVGEIGRHLQGLNRINPEHPVEVLIQTGPGTRMECAILAFDYPGEFSLIAGILAGMGFSIISGHVYTYARQTPASAPRIGQGAFRRSWLKPAPPDPWQRRRIVDCFTGEVDTGPAPEVWEAELRKRFEEVIGLLEQASPETEAVAKQRVNHMVARRLEELATASSPVLFPLQIQLDNDQGPTTRLKVISEDTPAFLYALSNALALRGISIERVRITTADRRIEDELEVVDAQGEPIRDPGNLDHIRLSVLLTKQFTHFLGSAPDPFSALSHFEHMVEDIVELPERGQWLAMFSDPRHLQNLARLLGTSEFLWEDIIRLQYETLLPILKPHVNGQRFSEPSNTLAPRLQQALAGVEEQEEQRRILNEFKDREIFLIDLDYILTAARDLRELAEHLTALAESVVRAASGLAYDRLRQRFGTPNTVAGLPARFAIFGLGKFGGAALGYASDIELLFVYSDSGFTSGPERIENREFFEHLARETAALIVAKREGIFQVDLRLRPYGEDGPLASSLEAFCGYYGVNGPALAYEKLSLVRLRAVAGDQELGEQVERLRDEFVYASGHLNIPELRELRQKQLKEKTRPGELNAKFSAGALVDLEYDVQILQIMHGQQWPDLRTPRIHQALNALQAAGVLAPGEGERLASAYLFLRRLINGLRMLRGSARDLCLPPQASDEYLHLARRLGYETKPGLTPEQQLHLDFETHTATVRAFVEQHFGHDSLPGPYLGNVADLVLSDNVPEGMRRDILLRAGFKNPERAYVNLRNLAERPGSREHLARLAVLACDSLAHKPDPDMALNNWEHFVSVLLEPSHHFENLLAQPMRLEILLNIFATSQFLADTLVRYPENFEWATDPASLRTTRRREDLDQELAGMLQMCPDIPAWLNALRRFQKRELLRIGTRDVCLHAPIREITLDLSTLADALIDTSLHRAWENIPNAADRFCILAFGKLGGQELNYSSDIDLLGLYKESEPPNKEAAEFFAKVMVKACSYLSQYTDEGYLYRVDLRLRPYSREGLLVQSIAGLIDYYQRSAVLPEIQSLLKLRPSHRLSAPRRRVVAVHSTPAA